jgi:hypothetical protein
MHRLLTLALILETAMLINTISLEAQDSGGSRGPAIAVSINLQKDNIPLGQSPWVALRIENLTDGEITIDQADPHVEGNEGELPMRPNARIVTDRLQSGIPRLRTVVYVPWTIPPKGSSIHTYQLAHFFDLSRQGRYTVYMEVMDPGSHKWLRTNSTKLEMQSPSH